jgi:transposase
MKTKIDWALGADVRVRGVTHSGGEWTLETVRVGPSRCPGCVRRLTSVHSTYRRRIQDLPMQTGRMILNARIRPFRCLDRHRRSVTFAERLDGIATPFARVTDQVLTLAKIEFSAHVIDQSPLMEIQRS